MFTIMILKDACMIVKYLFESCKHCVFKKNLCLFCKLQQVKKLHKCGKGS